MISYQMFKRLLQIAQIGSLAKAADVLFVSRPALVQQVKAAEAKLGFAVFERTAKGVSLTPVGKVFLEEGAPIINEYEELHRKCLRMTEEKPKTVIIGTLPEVYSPLLLAGYKKFREKYPDVDVMLMQESAQDYFPAFLAGKFDIVSDYMFSLAKDLVANPSLKILSCKPVQLNICVPNSSPLARLKTATVENLRGSRLMLHAPGLSKAEDRLRDYLERNEPSIQIADYVNYGHELLVQAEMENSILVCVRQYCLDIPHFTHIFMDWDFPVERGIIYKKNARPEVKNFIELLRQSVSEMDRP